MLPKKILKIVFEYIDKGICSFVCKCWKKIIGNKSMSLKNINNVNLMCWIQSIINNYYLLKLIIRTNNTDLLKLYEQSLYRKKLHYDICNDVIFYLKDEKILLWLIDNNYKVSTKTIKVIDNSFHTSKFNRVLKDIVNKHI